MYFFYFPYKSSLLSLADTDDGGKNTQGEEETGPEMKDKRYTK